MEAGRFSRALRHALKKRKLVRSTVARDSVSGPSRVVGPMLVLRNDLQTQDPVDTIALPDAGRARTVQRDLSGRLGLQCSFVSRSSRLSCPLDVRVQRRGAVIFSSANDHQRTRSSSIGQSRTSRPVGPGSRMGQARRLTAAGTVPLRHVAGAWPTSFLNARLNAASDS